MASLDAILAKHTAGTSKDTNGKLLGASFVVLNKDGVLYSGSAGRIDHAPDSRPWDVDSFTYVASLTKLITVTGIMQAVKRGLLDLDEDLRSLLPQLGTMQVLKGFDSEEKPILEDHDVPITLRMLLTHTVGLGYDLADPDLMKWHEAVGRTVTNLEWSVDGFTTPLKFKPGEGWFYGGAVDWAGFALEKKTGQTLGEYLSENIFQPLDMKDTGFWPERLPHVADRTVAWQYRGEDGTGLGPGPRPVPKEHPIESGGAGLWTTAHDYGKFLHALLANKIVEKETVDEMFRPQLNEAQAAMLKQVAYSWGALAVEFTPDMDLNFGFGGAINMADAPGKRRKGSLMWSGMCNSRWWMDRETGIAAVLFVQALPHGDPVLVKLYDELEKAVYGELLVQG